MTSGTPLAPSTSVTKTATAISLASINACGLSVLSLMMMEITTAKGRITSIQAAGLLALPGAVTLTSSTPKMPMP